LPNPFQNDRSGLVENVEGQDDQDAKEWGKAVFEFMGLFVGHGF
jgi:hypothetical protein